MKSRIYELITSRAQARNKELLAAMEERQQESVNIMRELVEEVKDMTKQYYEAQLEALRCEVRRFHFTSVITCT